MDIKGGSKKDKDAPTPFNTPRNAAPIQGGAAGAGGKKGQQQQVGSFAGSFELPAQIQLGTCLLLPLVSSSCLLPPASSCLHYSFSFIFFFFIFGLAVTNSLFSILYSLFSLSLVPLISLSLSLFSCSNGE